MNLFALVVYKWGCLVILRCNYAINAYMQTGYPYISHGTLKFNCTAFKIFISNLWQNNAVELLEFTVHLAWTFLYTISFITNGTRCRTLKSNATHNKTLTSVSNQITHIKFDYWYFYSLINAFKCSFQLCFLKFEWWHKEVKCQSGSRQLTIT